MTDELGVLSDYISPEQLAGQLMVTVRTLERWRRLNESPPITRLGRRVVYRRSAVEAWLKTREAA